MKRIAFIVIVLLCSSTLFTIAQEPGPTQTPIATAIDDDVTPTPVPKPDPEIEISQDDITVQFYFEAIKQGRAGLVQVSGENLSAVRARFLGKVIEFFPVPDEGFYGLLSVSMEQRPRTYDLTIFAIRDDAENTRISVETSVDVILGGFIRQEFPLPPDRAYLADAEVERAEFARLSSVFETVTLERLWGDEPMRLPINANLTSQFGAVRTLNDNFETFHTGWDLQATTGTPILSMAAGEVAFAGALDIRGNHVIIDHGYGVFSGYSHMSQMHVTRGQTINNGQVIGMTGNSGRSSGPHLHWEIAVNGDWVDSVDFLRMWLP